MKLIVTALLTLTLSACAAAIAQEAEPGDTSLTRNAKPVQCSSIEKVAEISKEKGLQITFGAQGLASDMDQNSMSVYVFLAVNPETKEWALTEVSNNGEDACILGYGIDFTIDAETMRNLSDPST